MRTADLSERHIIVLVKDIAGGRFDAGRWAVKADCRLNHGFHEFTRMNQ